MLRRAVFASPSEGRVAATHRQVAEFLAARYLADLIVDGLPVRRALALMTGFDGGILSELRGLSAWLATHSRSARIEIIERDPLGTVEYGDVGGFDTSGEKRHLLQEPARLKRTRIHGWWATATWTHLRDTLPAPIWKTTSVRRLPIRPVARRISRLFLLVVRAIRAGAPTPGLANPLMAIARDDSWPMDIRCAALEAYFRATQGDSQVAAALRALLDEVYAGVLATRNDDLLGTLLMELYPDNLTVTGAR